MCPINLSMIGDSRGLSIRRLDELPGWVTLMRVERPRLDIAFVSDVACPWCAIGLAWLDQALARLGGEVEASVRVEPFELNPDMGSEGAEVVPYLARKYGRTPAWPAYRSWS